MVDDRLAGLGDLPENTFVCPNCGRTREYVGTQQVVCRCTTVMVRRTN